jgi:hypothetical protein
MIDKKLKVGGDNTGINHEVVRYYPVDFAREKFFEHEAPKILRDYIELTKSMSLPELVVFKEHLEREILSIYKRMGS